MYGGTLPPTGGGNRWLRLLALLLPWKAAAFLFKPRYRLLPEDRVMSLIGRIRALAGLAMTVGIAIYYGTLSDYGLEPLVKSLTLTGVLAIPSMLICMGIVVVATRRGQRGTAVRRLVWPALTLVAFIVVLGGLLLFNAGASVLGRYDDNIPLNGKLYGGVVSLWFLVFALRGIYLISQYWFNAVDGHPYLQSLMTVWMAWVLAINTLAFQSGGDEGGVPASIAFALPILAGSVTTVFAIAEAARVRNTLRPAPTHVT